MKLPSTYTAAPSKPEDLSWRVQWCSTGEAQVMGTKVSVDIPIRKPDSFVLSCIWKCSPQLFMLRQSRALSQSANSAGGELACPPGRAVGRHWGITSTWIAACSSRTRPHVPVWAKAAPAPQQSSPVQGKSTYKSDLQVFCMWMAADFTSNLSKAS